ncbi:MAG: tripartite tricarboxylate transporter substrate binding protein [Pigmentiphaga sp.]|nr:tripartite tricarboxylate transporter substrate binding protein [Pigmentiphaga sp.]
MDSHPHTPRQFPYQAAEPAQPPRRPRSQRRRLLQAGCASLALTLATTWGTAQAAYPDKQVRIVVGFPAGGGVDGVARALAERLSSQLGQSFIVENKPGAAGTIAADFVAKAAPDGYTLYMSETAFLIAQIVMPAVKLDAERDFEAVGSIGVLPLMLAANPKLPVKTTEELIALLKNNPGKFSYGSAGVGTPHHFIFEMFAQKSGVDVPHVPYKGGAPMLPDLVEGRIELGMLSSAVAAPLVKDGRLVALAVTTAQPVSNLPGVPPLSETLPGFDAASVFFMLAPKGTPGDVINTLNTALQTAVRDPAFQKVLETQGALPMSDTPAELRQTIRAEAARWQEIAQGAGLAPQASTGAP